MIIVADTNVLIASFISRGVCAQVMERAIRFHRIAISSHIVGEFREHMAERYDRQPGSVLNAVQWLRANSMDVEPVKFDAPVCRDSDDDPVLGTAVAASAKVLVTLDKDLLVLNPFREIQIVTPGELLHMEGFQNPSQDE